MLIRSGSGMGCLLALTLTALLSAPLSAQVDTGTIIGTVKDQSGGVLPGATVTITHEGQALAPTTVTREDGSFIFTPIRTGAYSVEVDFPGFRKGIRRGLTVGIQETVRVDFTLQTGVVTEEVLVTGASPLLQTGSGTVGETLKSDMIENLPVNGRDYTVLARLTTGIVPPMQGSREARRREERRLPVEPVRCHRRRAGCPVENILVLRLRGHAYQAGAYVGAVGADRTPAEQRVHELHRSHRAAERHDWRRRARPQLSTRHRLRSRDDTVAAGGAGRSAPPHGRGRLGPRARHLRGLPDPRG